MSEKMIRSNRRHRILRLKALFCFLMALEVLSVNLPVYEVYAATEDESSVEDGDKAVCPSVIVGDYDELAQAIYKAKDGEVIGFDS